ncbi:2-amino-4-hydroxy-6-hydroxymethyldihydropteridine diphosphokinase [Actinotalea sp. Marseille-Q4924]|uniref:2-amino-4-hydroxy-6- hydroxymethyldihydropteridine diphosphokinase n=1 Tax=Actinotalea sp. Marseille-Q4924 TaxID=2866571 RepID=UPI001CE46FDF|nr:2-amino-4-hydroxy-6-hydroxymethyldihydropteridine diphosphokinase [Actinotalea sp. Marseille-Q4924]
MHDDDTAATWESTPTADAGASGAADRIRISGITATGHHGVFEHERRDGQTFVADVVLHVDTRPAAAQDRLDLTVDYGAVSSAVAAVLSGDPVDLIETVAERVAAVVLEHAGVTAVDVVLHKPQAPIPVPFSDVTVEIHRGRARPPVVGRRAGRHAAGAPEDGTTGDVERGGAAPERGPDTPAADGPGLVVLADVLAAVDVASLPTVRQEPGDHLDVPPAEPVDVVLALGSNLGASETTLHDVLQDLAALEGLELTAVSPLVRTAPVGGPDQPDYLNAVVLGRTTLAPRALLRACQAIEAGHGRERLVRWGPRTVDIDIVLHGRTLAVTDDLELPHPRAHERAFVLQPWAEVDPDAVLPGLGGGPVALLARTAPDRQGIRWMALDWWNAPEAG